MNKKSRMGISLVVFVVSAVALGIVADILAKRGLYVDASGTGGCTTIGEYMAIFIAGGAFISSVYFIVCDREVLRTRRKRS